MKKILTILVLIISLPLVLPVSAAEKDDAVKALKEARKLFDKAVAEQGGWQSTKKLITSAETSLSKGDSAKALSLAKKAKQEAKLSVSQAQRERKSWSEPGFLK